MILLARCASGWLANTKYHPHTHGLSEHAALVLEQHDKRADWTNQSALSALVLQAAYLIFLSRTAIKDAAGLDSRRVKRYKEIVSVVVAPVLVLSAYSVSRAGHSGAQLVHIEVIGPQGKFLEMEHHHERETNVTAKPLNWAGSYGMM